MEENKETIDIELIGTLQEISNSLSYIEEHLSKIVDKLSGIEMNTNNL